MLDSNTGGTSQSTLSMSTVRAVIAGGGNIPHRISAYEYTMRTPHSEPVTSSTSLLQNRSPGHAAGSRAGAALDQHKLFWLDRLGIVELLSGRYQSA